MNVVIVKIKLTGNNITLSFVSVRCGGDMVTYLVVSHAGVGPDDSVGGAASRSGLSDSLSGFALRLVADQPPPGRTLTVRHPRR